MIRIPDGTSFEEAGNIIAEALLKAPPESMAAVIGWLGRLTALANLRLVSSGQAGTQPQEGDRLLTVHEASTKLGMTTDYLYRHVDTLFFSVRTGPKQLRFSLKRIERYIAQKTSVHSRIDMNP